jgi:hypothetical protein
MPPKISAEEMGSELRWWFFSSQLEFDLVSEGGTPTLRLVHGDTQAALLDVPLIDEVLYEWISGLAHHRGLDRKTHGVLAALRHLLGTPPVPPI